MVDKPRKPGRPAGQKAGYDRSARQGDRPQTGAGGRNAGKPERGPARPRKVGGVDLSALDRLEAEGLLTEEGRRLRSQAMEQGRPQTPAGRRRPQDLAGSSGPQEAAGRARPAPRPRPQRDGAGEKEIVRPPRLPRGQQLAGGGRGYASVDEQLAQLPGRSLRPHARRPRGEREEKGPRRYGGAGPYARTREAERPPQRLSAAEKEVAERLQKVMSRAGVASRRHSEELIQAGRVTVNGRVVTELGTKVVAGRDLIELDGRPLGAPEQKIYLMLNKPKGYVTTLYDPQGRPKVTDLLGGEVAARVYPVGRLDYDTEGLLLLTNDGDLANGLMHPARQVRKTYIAKVRGVPGPAKLRALEEGVELEDGPTAPADVKMLEVKPPNAATVSIRIHEGRNRQVRRMFEAIGHEVIHLKRTTLGPLHLKDLPVGQYRALTDEEVRSLYTAAGLRMGGKPSHRLKSRK